MNYPNCERRRSRLEYQLPRHSFVSAGFNPETLDESGVKVVPLKGRRPPINEERKNYATGD